jgi:aspartate racemase
MKEKVVGILGGMGPEATVDLFQKVLKATPAKTDQEHLRIIIDCNSKIPDRTAYMLGSGEDPGPYMVESAILLEKAGAELILIPCNAAHNWHEAVQQSVNVPVLHIMRSALKYVNEKHPDIEVIGLLAATSTVKAGLYHRLFAKKNIEVISPEPEYQERVMKAVLQVKAGNTGTNVRRLLTDAGKSLVARGAQGVIAGCTEIPIVLKEKALPVPVIDATNVLALAAVKEALGRTVED